MIELVQAPDTNRVIADGNDTIIQLRTTTGASHFLRATIYIDGVKFMQQSWSKDEDSLCAFNLKHLYYAYFNNPFTEEVVTGFRSKTGLFKKVKIVTEEFAIGSTSVFSSLTLPEFYIIKNLKPQVFDDQKTVQFLDLPQENINCSRDGYFIFPLYVKAGDLLTVQVLNNLGQQVFTTTLEDYPTQVLQYEMNFPDFPVEQLTEVYVRFSTSQDQVQKKIKFIKEDIYPAKQIFYLNNCGFYCVALLMGKKENTHSLAPQSYSQYDGTEVTYNVEDTKELTLSSGYGYKDITSLIHSIATSVDVRMKLEGFWERVKSETKKVERLIDNQFIYSESLRFSRVNVANFTNENTFAMIPEVADIIKEGDENALITITKAEFLAVYTATQSATRLRIRTLPENGKVSYTTTAATYNLSDMAANNPAIMPFSIPLDTFVSLQYQPNYTLFGAPLDVVKFQIGASVLWSNVGDLILNVIDLPDANLPPNIVVNSIQEIALDGTGNASKLIDASITDPEGDPIQIVWEVLNGAPITFDNASAEKPTITITGGTANQTYYIKVTATDTANNLVSEKTISINTSSYAVSITSFGYPATGDEVNGYEQVYDIIVQDGLPNSEVTLRYEMSAVSFNQYVVINLNEPTERIITGNSSTLDTITLPADGRREFQVKIYNSEPNNVFDLTVKIDSVAGDQIISQYDTTVLSL